MSLQWYYEEVEEPDRELDGLSPARGILWGIILALLNGIALGLFILACEWIPFLWRIVR